MFRAKAGEKLFTTFEQSVRDALTGETRWTLTMGAVDDPGRVSTVVVDQPYMGIGAAWQEPTTSWKEVNYTNLCVNACWELYGAVDRDHLPSSGSHYDISVEQEKPHAKPFPWVRRWDEDEGA